MLISNKEMIEINKESIQVSIENILKPKGMLCNANIW